MTTVTADAPRRKWVYVGTPAQYEMAPCSCGNHDTQWSEFEKHLWCAVCLIDFIPAHAGILNGPVPIQTALLMGLSFDRINLETQELERFNPETLKFDVSSIKATSMSNRLDEILASHEVSIGLSNEKQFAGTWEWYDRSTKVFGSGFSTHADAYAAAAKHLQETKGATLPSLDEDGEPIN